VRSATVSITAAWAPDSTESYVNIDVESDALVTQTEHLWLA
jgi:hypothetical protein